MPFSNNVAGYWGLQVDNKCVFWGRAMASWVNFERTFHFMMFALPWEDPLLNYLAVILILALSRVRVQLV